MPTERPKQVRLNYAGNRACYDMKEDATQNVIFAIAQYSSKQLTKITDESGDRKAGYCAISGDCGETECTLAFISDMDLAGDSLEKGNVQVYTTKLIRENALGVPTFAPFTMITKASFDADSSSKAFDTHTQRTLTHTHTMTLLLTPPCAPPTGHPPRACRRSRRAAA